MNKNFQYALPSSFDAIEYPDFESRIEIYDWVIYQTKELMLLCNRFLSRDLKTRSFISYFDETNSTIRNALFLSRNFELTNEEEKRESSSKILEIQKLIDQFPLICEDLKRCPLVEE